MVSGSGKAEGTGPFGSRDFIVIFIAIMTAMVGLGVVGPLMPIYAETLGATGFWIGMIYSTFSIARAVFNQPVGILSDRLGRRWFLTGGLALYSTLSIFYIFADSVQELVVVRFFNGLGSALVIPVGMAYVGDLAPKGREGEYMGSFNIALFLGFGIGPFLGGVISDLFGYEAVFYVMGGMSFAATALTLVLVRSRARDPRKKRSAPLRKVVGNLTVQALFLWRSVRAFGRGFTIAFLAIFGRFELGLSFLEIGIVLTVYLVLMAVMQNATGKLADRFSRVGLVVWGSMISIGVLVLVPFARGFTDLLVIVIINGIGSAMALPSATAIATDVGRDMGMGSIMGIFNTAMSVGMIFGPISAGIIYDTMGIDMVFWIGSIIMVLGTLVFVVMMRRADGQGATRADMS